MLISVYADGSSTGRSNRPWGWAFVICREDQPVLAGYGGGPHGTNNIAELTAAIEGLKALERAGLATDEDQVELVSDSQYTLGIATGGFNPSKNLELARELVQLTKRLVWRTRWVRGHSGDCWQERTDSLAKKGKLEWPETKIPEKT